MAGPYPLATLAATILPTGISAPTYADIIASLIAEYQAIYGSDVVLDASTQDYQMLAIFASAINDCNAASIAVYNEFSPATAVGVGLSSVVKINGLARDIATNSTADLTIVGVAGTIITGGAAGDTLGNRWNLPPTVTIGGGGSVVATATAADLGALSAGAGTITSILTPTRGWQSVTNVAAATPGAPVEGDAALRRRQAVSTGLPAQTVLEAIVGNIKDLPGVLETQAYENDTATTDANGIPRNSISLVVLGGDSGEIGSVIARKKSPGTGTYGTTNETVVDQAGVSNTVHFYRPTIKRVIAAVTIKALAGYVSTTGDALLASMAAYVSALPIGTDVYLSNVIAAAVLDNAALSATYNVTALTQAFFGGTLAAADLTIAFNEDASLVVADITLTVT